MAGWKGETVEGRVLLLASKLSLVGLHERLHRGKVRDKTFPLANVQRHREPDIKTVDGQRAFVGNLIADFVGRLGSELAVFFLKLGNHCKQISLRKLGDIVGHDLVLSFGWMPVCRPDILGTVEMVNTKSTQGHSADSLATSNDTIARGRCAML